MRILSSTRTFDADLHDFGHVRLALTYDTKLIIATLKPLIGLKPRQSCGIVNTLLCYSILVPSNSGQALLNTPL